ncbi:hypothetical protein [Burkholderia territorii]|uniref:hypothetical protein n=1 Tax=Burkholderia territorii TaxID=1503055 RepID=UPI001E2BB4CC|nr:hypothetical protein [Burkholderia territorii]
MESETTELVADDRLVEAEVDSDASWPPLTASVLVIDTLPFAKLVIFLLFRDAPPFNDVNPEILTIPRILVPLTLPSM